MAGDNDIRVIGARENNLKGVTVSIPKGKLVAFAGVSGSGGLFGAMIAAGVATSLYIKLSGIDKLKINMGEGVPPMVSQTFSGLIPMMIVLSLFGAVAMACQALFGMDVMSIIRMFISTPLQKLGSLLPAVLLIYSLGNLLWIVGVHNSTIQATILDPS